MKARSQDEAVWTLDIHSIRDAQMKGLEEMLARLDLVTKVIGDQRALLNQYVTKQWGPAAQRFLPDKGVLAIYDPGLQVPPELAILRLDDHLRCFRRLSSPQERQHDHLSYHRHPHSYTWINTTSALLWEKMCKAWENEARTVWMLNVGDIKPGEIGISYFSRPPKPDASAAGQRWRGVATADLQTTRAGVARWTSRHGLEPTGRVVSLQPAKSTAGWPAGDISAPCLEYAFRSEAGDAEAIINFVPTFRLVPKMKSRVGVRVDNGSVEAVEIPGSSGTENENGSVRQVTVQNHDVRLRVPPLGVAAGQHTFRTSAVDPASVIDRVFLPE